MWSPIPARRARILLESEPLRLTLLAVNAIGILAGLNFYRVQAGSVPVPAWPLLMDSAVALALASASLLTLLPFRSVDAYSDTPVLCVLNTLAFASLVKYGAWTAIVLLLFFDLYYPALWAFFGIMVTHAFFFYEAFLLPYYAKTSRLALGVTAGWFVANDVADYGFGIHPHLRAEQLGPLPAITVALSAVALLLAAVCLDRVG